jgi:hypothetical protein
MTTTKVRNALGRCAKRIAPKHLSSGDQDSGNGVDHDVRVTVAATDEPTFSESPQVALLAAPCNGTDAVDIVERPDANSGQAVESGGAIAQPIFGATRKNNGDLPIPILLPPSILEQDIDVDGSIRTHDSSERHSPKSARAHRAIKKEVVRICDDDDDDDGAEDVTFVSARGPAFDVPLCASNTNNFCDGGNDSRVALSLRALASTHFVSPETTVPGDALSVAPVMSTVFAALPLPLDAPGLWLPPYFISVEDAS